MTEQLMTSIQNNSELKIRLQTWANRNGIRSAEFAKKMDYTYQHAYQILRGEAPVTVEVIGRLVIAYGPEAAAAVVQQELPGIE